MIDSTNDQPMDEMAPPAVDSVPEPMARPSQKSHMKELIGLVAILIILVGIGASVILAGRTSENKSKAASATGTAKFSFSLPGGGITFAPSTQTTMTLKATSLGQSQIEGFQMIAAITGDVPATMTFTPATVNGMTPVSQSIVDDANGKRMTVAFITSNPQAPFSSNGADVTLGTLSFVSPASGKMTITIDQMTSKILQSVTGNDLLANQSPVGFSVIPPVTPVPTTLPTIMPTATATPRATTTPTVTPRPSVIPTAIPTALPTVKPTALPTSVPTPISTTLPTTAICKTSTLSVVPYPDASVWNSTGQFVVKNTGTSDVSFNWSLAAWTNSALSKNGVATLQPGKTVTLGLGQICSKWSLNIGCPPNNNQLGYTVESNQSACVSATATPAPTIIATPRPSVIPTAIPAPANGWTNFWRRWFSTWRR